MAQPEYQIFPKLGDVVLLEKAIATVMYIGPVHWNKNANGTYVGLELPEQIQNGHNGTYDNVIYFKCKPKRGIILPIDTIIKIIPPRELFNKLTTFKSQLKTVNDENEKLKQQIPQINSDDDDTKEFETINDEKRSLNDYKVLKNEFNELSMHNKELCDKLDAITTEKLSMEELNTNHTLSMKQKDIATDVLKEEKNELETLNCELLGKYNDIEAQNTALMVEKDEFEKLQKQLQKQLIEKYKNEFQMKSNENNDLLKINENQRNDIEQKKNEIERLECKIKESELQLENAKQQNDEYKANIDEMQQYKCENNELIETNKQLESELDTIKQQKIEQKNNFEAINDEMTDKMNDIKQQNEELTDELNDELKNKELIKSEIDKIKDELTKEIMEEKQQKNESLEKVDNLNKKIEKLHFDMQQMEEDLEEEIRNILRIKYENDLKAQLTKIQLEYEENITIIIRKAKADAKADVQDGNITKLRILLNEQKEKDNDDCLNNLLKEMSVKYDEYEQIIGERDELKLRNSKMKKKLKTANKEKDNLLILYEKQEKQVKIVKIENKKLQQEIESNKIDNRKLRKRIRKLNANSSHRDLKSVVIQSMDE